MKRSKKLLLLLMAVVISLAVSPLQVKGRSEQREETTACESIQDGMQAPDPSALYAKAAVLMDAESGRILYEKNGWEILPMASTTKILTCIIALENADPQEWVDISSYAPAMPKVKLYVKKGERYRLEDLLYSLMLESHNDTAVAVAEHVGKKFLEEELRNKNSGEYTLEESKKAVAAFAGLMNEKAEELGCEDSWFITPNGLDATETFHQRDGNELVKMHSTTAMDLARIMSYCILHSPQKEEFLKITGAPSHAVSSQDGTRNFFCYNHNSFLNMMEGALSGKTGFTNQAGYCYVGALQRGERTFVVALLACGWPNNRSYKWTDTRLLMNYGLDNFSYHTFEEAGEGIKLPNCLPVKNAQTDKIGEQAYVRIDKAECTKQSPEGVLLTRDEKVEVTCRIAPFLTAPVKAGDVAGSIVYEAAGQVYRVQNIVVTEDIRAIDPAWCIRKVVEKFFMQK